MAQEHDLPEYGRLREADPGRTGRAAWPVLEEGFECPPVEPEWMDAFWSQGWRHFGNRFFRYSVAVHEGQPTVVLPLRLDLVHWTPSKSQARIARRNQDLAVEVVPPRLDDEHAALFAKHVRRFSSNIPESLTNFLGPDPRKRRGPQAYPCECVEVSVRRKGCLIAASYLDLGREAASSVYGMFDPDESRRSLGIATLLWEISQARQRRLRYLYPGYVYAMPSPYDYKKRLGSLEVFDWRAWRPWSPDVATLPV